MADLFSLFKQIEKNEPKNTEPITWLIVGLGNPGDKYFYTRHNTGFLTMDYLSQKYKARVDRAKFKALVGEALIAGQRCLLMKPQTFMNHSGQAVAEAASFYKIPPERVLVFSDDISLPIGRLRARTKGSDGGQRGLRSIIAELGTDIFPRIRIGVGEKPHPDYDLANWVLSEFTADEKRLLFTCFEPACQGTEAILTGQIDRAQQICNSFVGALPGKD